MGTHHQRPLVGHSVTDIQTAGFWRTNAELIEHAAELHWPDEPQILDATWGKGNFWTGDMLEAHIWRLATNDANKETLANTSFDYRRLPGEWSDYFDVVLFDPPYIAKGTTEGHGLGQMNQAYGLAPTNAKELLRENQRGLFECERVTKPGGLLMVKCSNQIESGHYRPSARNLAAFADLIGLTQIDEFIFTTPKARAQPARTRKDGTPSVQHHARNNTSTLLVYRKHKPRRRSS